MERKLNAEHSTAVLIVAVGHDKVAGQMTVVTVDDISDDKIIIFLQSALKQLRSRN